MAMSQIAMELDQKAAELGFESLQEALDAGCEVEYGSDGNSELVEPLVAAHRAWEKEREDVLASLNRLHRYLGKVYQYFSHPTGASNWWQKELERAIKFIKEAHE